MRLLATDLDGTLLGVGGQVSERSVAALRCVHDAGWYVVLATGRPPFMVDLLLPRLGDVVTHGVMANGSVVATLPDQRVMRAVRFDIGLATSVVERLRTLDDEYGFALATDAGFAHETGFAERMPAPTPTPPTADVLEAAAGATEAVKLLVFHRRTGAHELLGLLPTILGRDVSVTHMGADCVEVGVAGEGGDVGDAEAVTAGGELDGLGAGELGAVFVGGDLAHRHGAVAGFTHGGCLR